MWVRRRRRMTSALTVLAAIVSIAGCNASRPSAAPTTTTTITNAGLGPPEERPPESASGVASGSNERPAETPTTPDDIVVGPSPATAESPPPPATLATPSDDGTAADMTTPLPAVAPNSTLPRPTEDEWLAFDTYLRERLLDAGDFAFGVAVSIDGEAVHVAAYGDRNPANMVIPPPEDESSDSSSSTGPTSTTTTTTTQPPLPLDPVDTSDRFRIASLSKVITGTVVLQLVDSGQLGLDEAVGEQLGEALGVDVSGRPVEDVTVRQLLSHTSGFNVFDNTFFDRGVESCREAAIRGFDQGLAYDPGTIYEYSNMNFCVLGLLIEDVTGQPYQEAVYQRLLTPLGITGMRLAGTFDPAPDEVVHPSFPDRNYMETLGGAGAWVATPADVVAILDSLDNDKPGFHPLSDRLSELMREPVSGIEYRDPFERWYGLATIAFANQSWGHTGTIENTHAMVMNRPDGMTWAILVSGNYPEDTDDLAAVFQSALDQAGIAAPAPTTSTTTTTSTSTTSTTSTVPPGAPGLAPTVVVTASTSD